MTTGFYMSPACRGCPPLAVQRTPHAVVREPALNPGPDWGRNLITPNGGVVALDGFGAVSDTAAAAIARLEAAGSRGATLLGVVAGLTFAGAGHRLMGGLVGGLLGYLGGGYLTNFAKRMIAAQTAVLPSLPVVVTSPAGKAST